MSGLLSDDSCTRLRILPVLKQLVDDKKLVRGQCYFQNNLKNNIVEAIEKFTKGSEDNNDSNNSISFLKCFQERCSGVLQIEEVDATEFKCSRQDCNVNKVKVLDSSPNQRDSVVVAGLVLFGYYYRDVLSDNDSPLRGAVKEYLTNALAESSIAEHKLFPMFLNKIKQPYFAISQKRGLDFSDIFSKIGTKRPDFILLHRIYGNLAVDVKCYDFGRESRKKFKIGLSEVIKASNFRKLSSGTRHWFAMYDKQAVIDFRSSCKEDGYPLPYLLPLSHILREYKFSRDHDPIFYLDRGKESYIEVDVTDHDPGTFKYPDNSYDIEFENFSDLYWQNRSSIAPNDETSAN